MIFVYFIFSLITAYVIYAMADTVYSAILTIIDIMNWR